MKKAIFTTCLCLISFIIFSCSGKKDDGGSVSGPTNPPTVPATTLVKPQPNVLNADQELATVVLGKDEYILGRPYNDEKTGELLYASAVSRKPIYGYINNTPIVIRGLNAKGQIQEYLRCDDCDGQIGHFFDEEHFALLDNDSVSFFWRFDDGQFKVRSVNRLNKSIDKETFGTSFFKFFENFLFLVEREAKFYDKSGVNSANVSGKSVSEMDWPIKIDEDTVLIPGSRFDSNQVTIVNASRSSVGDATKTIKLSYDSKAEKQYFKFFNSIGDKILVSIFDYNENESSNPSRLALVSSSHLSYCDENCEIYNSDIFFETSEFFFHVEDTFGSNNLFAILKNGIIAASGTRRGNANSSVVALIDPTTKTLKGTFNLDQSKWGSNVDIIGIEPFGQDNLVVRAKNGLFIINSKGELLLEKEYVNCVSPSIELGDGSLAILDYNLNEILIVSPSLKLITIKNTSYDKLSDFGTESDGNFFPMAYDNNTAFAADYSGNLIFVKSDGSTRIVKTNGSIGQKPIVTKDGKVIVVAGSKLQIVRPDFSKEVEKANAE